ncbi:MAG: hypothetical protein HZA77_09655 [Candidatus Schekmanbacteria bacterium]|nr:hypothetical protein [Candidatus Schekmanbacteria bacterium]
MKNSIKATLLSGLVFPGLGQVLLKKYKRGTALIILVSISLLVIVVKAVQKALVILDKIKTADGGIDINEITKAATDATSASDSIMSNLAFLFLIVCWIFAIVDAYIAGKKKDREEQSANNAI